MLFRESRFEFSLSPEPSASSTFNASTFAPVSSATFHTFSMMISSAIALPGGSGLGADGEGVLPNKN